MNPLTSKLAGYLPNQYHKHALEVNSHLRVKGAPLGTVYAIGNASTIETNLVNYLLNLVDQCDSNKDGKIDFKEFEIMIKQVSQKFPTAQVHIDLKIITWCQAALRSQKKIIELQVDVDD
ncbi:hypothetical protein BY996DRAFT_1397047 [Phakopsora pachyrhizi]|nr:hypothetical protein BY996DRAFT_1397047 [Phakopsora pachyrhizi]